MHNKKPTAFHALGRSQTALTSLGALVLMAAASVQPAQAQVRVYDATSGQSTPQSPAGTAQKPATAESSGSIGGIRTETTAAPAPVAKVTPKPVAMPQTAPQIPPQIGGIRVENTPTQTLQSGTKTTTINQGKSVTATPASTGLATAAKTLSVTTVTTTRKTTYVPDRVATDALGNPIPTSAQKNGTTPASLGQVFVFIDVSEFSPIVSKRLEELSKVPGITPAYYMDERRPQEYMTLLGDSFFKVANKISFQVDGSGLFAEAYGVKEANILVYRAPNGSIRRYKLVSELPVFIEMLNRLRQGQST